MEQRARDPESVSFELYALARGPSNRALQYTACTVRGYRFHTLDRERNRKTQNCGVLVEGSYGTDDIDYYGVIRDIIGLKYLGGSITYVFKCDWWDLGGGRDSIYRDNHFTSVNTASKWYEDDPFVLACQATQIYYLIDPMKSADEDSGEITWRVVQKFVPRNIYEVATSADYDNSGDEDDTLNVEAYQEDGGGGINLFVDLGALELLPLCRDDVPLIHLDPSSLNYHSIEESEKSTEEESEEEDEQESGGEVDKDDEQELDDDDEDVIQRHSETNMENTSEDED